MRNEWDTINERKFAIREAVEKTTAEVTESIAKAMLADGVPAETVAHYTKLDIEAVKKLREQN